MDRQSIIGQAGAFLDAIELAGRAAGLDRPVLVIGERGTGKELIAQRLHHLSPRWDKPLVTMNCAALPETLIEAELFGHEAGAFTGATRARMGRFEEADGGTLFLDELGTLSMAAQERLLRVIEYGEVTRIGASRPVTVDVRIVAATNENLPRAAEEHRFRADLLDRLSFEVITLPPLRVREGDVRVLAEHFGLRMGLELGWEGWPGFAPEVMAELEAHDWPGNVRELRNVAERYALGLPVFRKTGAAPDSHTPRLAEAVEAFEKSLIRDTLERHGGNLSQASVALGIAKTTLFDKVRKYGLNQPG